MDRERILIVEDDPQLAKVLDGELLRAYDTVVVGTGKEALARAETEEFDLILLDLNLPDMDGLDVAAELRENPASILMLTARADVRSRVAGLYIGADDYLAKPFDMQELLARVYAQLRSRGRQDVYSVGPVTLSLLDHTCTVDGELVILTAQEFNLLALLLANQGRVYSKNTLEDRLYRDAQPTSNAVEVLVSRLRGKLASAGAPGIVETVRGLGYVTRERT
ncbi:MAG TPA: response regulator transcription factor [Trueperaceae bacterium]|nr:response regulator transcription factor [Trueperaceae bacterium]